MYSVYIWYLVTNKNIDQLNLQDSNQFNSKSQINVKKLPMYVEPLMENLYVKQKKNKVLEHFSVIAMLTVHTMFSVYLCQ